MLVASLRKTRAGVCGSQTFCCSSAFFVCQRFSCGECLQLCCTGFVPLRSSVIQELNVNYADQGMQGHVKN